MAQRKHAMGVLVSESDFEVLRVLNNNAVVAQRRQMGVSGEEVVLLGKGIGFGVATGAIIDPNRVQTSYVALDSTKASILHQLSARDPEIFDAITAAVALAEEVLGGLAPSVYLALTDHIAFALARIERGELIESPILPEIRAVYPEEFQAAQMVVAKLNKALSSQLPVDEAAYVAMHLNAARLGVSVKSPLGHANFFAQLLDGTKRELGLGAASLDDGELIGMLIGLRARLRADAPRHMEIEALIRRELPQEYAAAEKLIAKLAEPETVSAKWSGESAFLAVALHSWSQSRAEGLSEAP